MKTQRYYIDTNVFIALIEMKGSSFELFVDRIASRDATLFTSEITLAELLVKPLQQANMRMASLYERLLQSGELLKVIPVHREILRASAGLRAKFPNKLPDAIHIATAMHTQCAIFVSSDQRLKLPASLSQVRLDQLNDVGYS